VRSRDPLIDMTMMRIRGVWTTNLAAFLLGAGMYASFIVFPQFAQLPKSTGFGFGASVVVSGLYLLPSTLGMTILGTVAGRISRRFGSRKRAARGTAFTTASFALLAVAHGHPYDLLIAAALLGIGIGLAFAALGNLIVQAVSPHQTGVASGMNTVMRTLGGALGGQLSATFIAANNVAHGRADGDRLHRSRTFLMATGFLLVCLLAGPLAVGEAVDAGGRARLPRLGLERIDRLDRRANLRAREHLLGRPLLVGVERHELDEADLIRGLARHLGERQHLLLGEVPDRDGIDLDRVRLGERGQALETAHHPGQRVAARELEEAVLLEGVDRDVEAVDPGRHQRLGVALEQEPVGRDREVVDVLERREHRRELRESLADERLAAGQPYVADPHRREQGDDPLISSKVRISSRSSHGRPSAGMQYWQRKLQRSVTDMRTSPIKRPCPS
jgi:hypothetical protein